MKKSILSLVELSQPSKADPCLGNQLKPSKFALLNRVSRALCLAARIAESREFPGVTINRGDLQPCNAPPPTPTDAAGRRMTHVNTVACQGGSQGRTASASCDGLVGFHPLAGGYRDLRALWLQALHCWLEASATMCRPTAAFLPCAPSP
jgi:hypothetical protein